MFLRAEPVVWFEHVAQPRMYRWNKFRSSLERNFGSLGANWERQMVKEFGNSIDDSSKGGLGRCESAGPSNALGRDPGDDGSDSDNDEEDPEENPKGETDEAET